MFWVISVYFNIRNILPKSGTFLLGNPVCSRRLVASWSWVVNATLRSLHRWEGAPVPIVREAGWAPGPVWTGLEKTNFLPPSWFNPSKPKDSYIGRTAPLTSRRCILYIYSTNIRTEYFKHAAHSPFFLLKIPFIL